VTLCLNLLRFWKRTSISTERILEISREIHLEVQGGQYGASARARCHGDDVGCCLHPAPLWDQITGRIQVRVCGLVARSPEKNYRLWIWNGDPARLSLCQPWTGRLRRVYLGVTAMWRTSRLSGWWRRSPSIVLSKKPLHKDLTWMTSRWWPVIPCVSHQSVSHESVISLMTEQSESCDISCDMSCDISRDMSDNFILNVILKWNCVCVWSVNISDQWTMKKKWA